MADRQRSSYCSKFCVLVDCQLQKSLLRGVRCRRTAPNTPAYGLCPSSLLHASSLFCLSSLIHASSLCSSYLHACSACPSYFVATSEDSRKRAEEIYYILKWLTLQTWRIVGPPGRWNDVRHISHRTNRPHNGTKLCLPAGTQHDQVERPGPKERYRRRDLLVKSED